MKAYLRTAKVYYRPFRASTEKKPAPISPRDFIEGVRPISFDKVRSRFNIIVPKPEDFPRIGITTVQANIREALELSVQWYTLEVLASRWDTPLIYTHPGTRSNFDPYPLTPFHASLLRVIGCINERYMHSRFAQDLLKLSAAYLSFIDMMMADPDILRQTIPDHLEFNGT